MKIPIGLILLGLSLELHAGGTVFTNPAAAQSEINLLPERHMIVFRHGIRADNHFRETHPDVTRDDWVRYVDEHRLGWELHNPGLAAQQVELEASIRSLLALQVRPTVIIASPYLRSIETALIIQRSFPGIEIVVDRRLSEWSYAAFGIHSDPFVHVPATKYRHIPARRDRAVRAEKMSAGSCDG